VRFRVIGSISLNMVWPTTWRAPLPFDARDLVNQGKQLGDIMTVRSGQATGQRNAVGIGEHMVLASQFAPIRGIWAGFFTAARSTYRGAIHQSAIPVDLVSRLEFGEQRLENPLPNPSLLPLAKATQAGVPGGKVRRGRKPPPRDPGSQDEKDAGDNPTRVRRLAPRELDITILRGARDQWLEAFPKAVRQNRLSHEEGLRRGLPQTPADDMPNGHGNG
jgi:hypothetical protein